MTRTDPRTDYGTDAPQVIRNLAVGGAVSFAIAIVLRHGIAVAGGGRINIAVSAWVTGAVLTIEAVLMIVYARIGKFHHRDRLLAMHPWRGDEQVLDVGTGRGLLLVGAAKHLVTGRATGIDIWRAEDLTGNTRDAAQRNIDIEGVGNRCTLQSMPAERMTFADASFDVVVSNLCLHNIEERDTRAAACREIARVLRPGGVALISDFRHTAEYAGVFRGAGCEVRLTAPEWLTTFPPLRTVVARKA